MITFDSVDRNYEIAKKTFSLDIPEFFNFAFDVLIFGSDRYDGFWQ